MLLAGALTAVGVSAVPSLTAEALSYLLAGLVLFLAVIRWATTRRRMIGVWGGLVAVGLVLVVLAPFGMELVSSNKLIPLPDVYTSLSGRMPAFINTNVLAGALVMLWPIALSAPRLGGHRVGDWLLRILAWSSAALMVATIVITQSRGAYLSIVVEAVLLLGLRWPKSVLIILPLILILAVVVVNTIGWETILDELTTGSATSGLDQRIEIWSRALYAVQDFPFTGVGLGTFEQVMAVLYPLFLNPAGTVPHAHNLFLQVAVDLGLPGLVAYLSILGLVFSMAFSSYRTLRSRRDFALSGLCAGGIVALVGMCAHGLVDATSWGRIKLAFIPWVLIALLTALYRLTDEPARASNG